MNTRMLLALSLMCFYLPAQPPRSDEPQYTKDGQLVRPDNYREWIYLSSGLGMTYGVVESVANPVQRFDNVPVRVAGRLHWDILRIHRGVVDGLREAGRVLGRLDSVGIDSWGVDYGLLDRDGRLIGNPVHYRDGRTDAVAPNVSSDGVPFGSRFMIPDAL